MKNSNKKEEPFQVPLFVRAKGLEPPRLAAPDPKSGAAANYATPACVFKLEGKDIFFSNAKKILLAFKNKLVEKVFKTSSL